MDYFCKLIENSVTKDYNTSINKRHKDRSDKKEEQSEMKKQKMMNRVSSFILAIVMVLGLCFSPIAAQRASAGEEEATVDTVRIIATQDNLSFEEGQEEDLSSYFTLEYEGLYCLYGYYSETYYYTSTYSEILTLTYYEVEGETETELETAPKLPGTYKVTASLTDDYFYAYDEEQYLFGFYGSEIESASIQYTITGDAIDVSDAVKEGNLKLLCGPEELADEDAFILLMFGDGFTETEQDTFYTEAQNIADYIMQTSPYDEFTDVIKIYAYGVASNESGARADKATTQAEADEDTRDTFFETSYWTGGMQRLLYASDNGLAKVRALSRAVLPEADFNVLVVNSDVYGGSGGEVCVASLNYLSTEMMLHELGHTVGDLADEYWAGAIYASEDKVNMTQQSDPEKVKWARFVGKNGIGVYKHNQTETSDWYRPSENCKMQYLSPDSPFCEVCKEKLRQSFCQYSKITKMFFQTYADEFYQGGEGIDMSQYFIIRRGNTEVTGDELDGLELVYKDADGNVLEGAPSAKGTYTVEAHYAGDDYFEACSASGTYSIVLSLIELEVESVKEYDGEAPEISVIHTENYDEEYTDTVRYTGVQYAGVSDLTYDSETVPTKPGKYKVTVSVYNASGALLLEKSASFQINYKVNRFIDNNSADYPGAQDWYNNKQIVIVGEGFTESEQDEFERAAQEYAAYILKQEPYRQVTSYFNFTTVETVSEESGSGKTARNTFFGLTYDDNGKINADNAGSISGISYYNVSPYRAATIVIVNDKAIKSGNVSGAVFYGGLNPGSKSDVANELLNYLTGHEVGYRATSAEEQSTIRTELFSTLYYTFYGVDYAVIAGQAYNKEFFSGQPADMEGCFETYILGQKVPEESIEYSYKYYDKNGTELEGAPSEPGTYTVVAEPVLPVLCAYDEYYEYFEVKSDYQLEEVYEEGYGYYTNVYDADGNWLGWLADDVGGITVDGQFHCVPRSRGTSSFTIISACYAEKVFGILMNLLTSLESTDKGTIEASWTTLYGADGYQVEYSTGKSFRKAERTTVTDAAHKSVSISGLRSKAKIYVRVRAYKTINGKRVYSRWSNVRSVKVK